MTSEVARQAIETPDGWFEFAPHHCFACGSLNRNGLGLLHHVEPGRSWTELTLDRRFEGWEGIVHGGIVSRSSTRSWPGRSSARTTGASRRGCRSSSAGRSRSGRRSARTAGSRATGAAIVDTAGRIVDSTSGEELATATGLYVAADAERKRLLQERYAFRPVNGAES